MTTIVNTKSDTRIVTATDVREVAAAISKEIIALYEFYARRFPYNVGKIRNYIRTHKLQKPASQLLHMGVVKTPLCNDTTQNSGFPYGSNVWRHCPKAAL